MAIGALLGPGPGLLQLGLPDCIALRTCRCQFVLVRRRETDQLAGVIEQIDLLDSGRLAQVVEATDLPVPRQLGQLHGHVFCFLGQFALEIAERTLAECNATFQRLLHAHVEP